MDNDYLMSHTFDQFDDFVNGRPIRPYDVGKYKTQPNHSHNSYHYNVNQNTFNNRYRNNSDFDRHRNMILNEAISQPQPLPPPPHYEPYFSKSTKNQTRFNQPSLLSPTNSIKSLFANSQSDFNLPPIRNSNRSGSQLSYAAPLFYSNTSNTPLIQSTVPPTVHYVPSPVSNPTIVKPHLLPATTTPVQTIFHPIQQPNVTTVVSQIPSRHVGPRPAPIINTFTYQPVGLPSIRNTKQIAPKLINAVNFRTRIMPKFSAFNQSLN